MTTCDEIIEIISNPDRENIVIDFKNSDIIKNDDGKKKLLKHIVSFANRNGGRILIGINDDCTFEGKKIFNVDDDKGLINNIIQDNISPKLECEIEFAQCPKGDVMVIRIPRKKSIPHAVIKRKESEIKSREYYIRTSHGKRLMSDRQLELLFKEENLDFTYPFRFTLNFIREPLKMVLLINSLPCINSFYDFFDNLDEKDLKLIKDADIAEALRDLIPYILLGSFSKYFGQSWSVKLLKNDQISINQLVPRKKITLEDLPKPQENSVLGNLTKDFKDYFDIWIFHDFFIPPATEIVTGNGFLKLENDDFEFIFSFPSFGGGAGMRNYQVVDPLGTDFDGKNAYADCFHATFSGYFNAKFNLPEKNFELYRAYYQYAKTLRAIIEKDWDLDKFTEKLPQRILFSIENKVDKLLDSLDEFKK